jgi:hypothetical protein
MFVIDLAADLDDDVSLWPIPPVRQARRQSTPLRSSPFTSDA